MNCEIEEKIGDIWITYCYPTEYTLKEHTEYINSLRKKNPNKKYRLVQVISKRKILKN